MSRYQKLLVLLDLSPDGEQVASAAKALAGADAAVVALHVVEFVPPEPMGETLMPTVQIEQAMIERSGEKLRAMVARLNFPNPTCRVEAGNIKSEILRVAGEEQVDLIIVGSRERHGLGVLVNFTEDTVLHAAHCDVLAVRLK